MIVEIRKESTCLYVGALTFWKTRHKKVYQNGMDLYGHIIKSYKILLGLFLWFLIFTNKVKQMLILSLLTRLNIVSQIIF